MEENKNLSENEEIMDGGFLQSDWWKEFQSSVGRKTLNIKGDNFWANIIEHKLVLVGSYFYIPRGNILKIKHKNVRNYLNNLVILAKENRVGWIRIEPASLEVLELTRQNTNLSIVKSPHQMQPKEFFIIDISKSEEELLAEMKPKTRYNIRLAERKNIKIIVSNEKKFVDKFCDLVDITSKRHEINSHPRFYYKKMFEVIPSENIKLYSAKYKGEIIAANMMITYGNTVIYLHGASDDRHRNLMAPYLLQWKQIQDAKKSGATRYDFGGVKTKTTENNWAGITRFKQGFSPKTKAVEYVGAYDIIVNPWKYQIYNFLRKIKNHSLELYKYIISKWV